jgi:hypothetical protein
MSTWFWHKNQVWQYLSLIVISHWHVMVSIQIWDIFVILLLSILCGESCLLVSWCVGDRYDMAGSDKDLSRSRRPGAEDRRWSSTGQVLGGQTIRRSGDTVCICVVYKETRSAGLLVWPQHQCHRLPCLDLKIGSSGLVIWASKSPWRFLSLGLKTKLTMVCQLHHKINERRMAWDTRRDLSACLA